MQPYDLSPLSGGPQSLTPLPGHASVAYAVACGQPRNERGEASFLFAAHPKQVGAIGLAITWWKRLRTGATMPGPCREQAGVRHPSDYVGKTCRSAGRHAFAVQRMAFGCVQPSLGPFLLLLFCRFTMKVHS